MTRDMLYAAARQAIEGHKVTDIRITKFHVEELSRANRFAKTSFLISGSAGDFNFFYRVETDFVLEGDAWKLKDDAILQPGRKSGSGDSLPGI